MTRQRLYDSELGATIAILKARVAELEAKEARLIPELEACRALLKSTRLSLGALIKSRRNFQAPVSMLPPEVLAFVFEAALGDRARVFQPFAIVLSHVCQTWRAVAVSDPFLWTDIQIGAVGTNCLSSLFLERSKTCDINVHYVYDVAQPQLFRLAILHLHRCRRLLMTFPGCMSATMVLRTMVLVKTPRLRSFQIDVGEISGDREVLADDGPLRIFEGGAPILTAITLNGISSMGCQPPLAALTSLELNISSLAAELSFTVCELPL